MKVHNSFELANAIGWKLDITRFSDFPKFIHETVEDELSGFKSLAYYQNRLAAMGFSGLPRVLDAGCGTGQWSVALASINQRVDAVDVDQNCIKFTEFLSSCQSINNLTIQFANVDSLPFEENTFDAITCYSVLMLCNARPIDLLKEFYRVLKPGGKLYLSVDDFGWYLHLLINRGRTSTFWKRGLRTLKNLVTNQEVKIMLTKGFLKRYLNEAGFRIAIMTHEGGINFKPESLKVQPAFPQRYFGFNAITDVLAIKL